jgi:hypothetical protein
MLGKSSEGLQIHKIIKCDDLSRVQSRYWYCVQHTGNVIYSFWSWTERQQTTALKLWYPSIGLHGVTAHNTVTTMNIMSKGRIYITNFFKQKSFNSFKSLHKKPHKEFILFMSHFLN